MGRLQNLPVKSKKCAPLHAGQYFYENYDVLQKPHLRRKVSNAGVSHQQKHEIFEGA